MINETLVKKLIQDNNVEGIKTYSEDLLRFLEHCYLEGVKPDIEIDSVLMYDTLYRICPDLDKYL